MRIGSLFSGIGGLEFGLELAGVGKTVWQVENNPFCQKVLRKNWPNTRLLGDIRDLDTKDLERVEVVCGGFPCQDISIAGKGAGILGPRSSLWFQFERVLSEIRPEWAVIENVPILRRRGLPTVLWGLTQLGYSVWWGTLGVSQLGGSHKRERLFILANSNRSGPLYQTVFRPGERDYSRFLCENSGEETGGIKSRLGGTITGIPSWLDQSVRGKGKEQHIWEQPRQTKEGNQREQRLKALGNSVSPYQSFAIGKLLLSLSTWDRPIL